MGSEESTQEEAGQMRILSWMCVWCYKDGQHNKELKNQRDNKTGRNVQESAGKKVKVVRDMS